MSQFVTFKLTQPAAHGYFTVGQSYPCIRKTAHGNGGERGFYWDDRNMVRMVPGHHFEPEPNGVWQPPEPCRYLPNKQRQEMADRWGITKQTVYNWQRGTQPIRFHDLLLGATLPRCAEPVENLREFAQQHGVYIQELAARWNFQQFGQYLKRDAEGANPAYFWDLWRGMLIAAGEQPE